MNLLPDASDLINLMERASPFSATTFTEYLHNHDHEIVLSFTNVRELVSTISVNRDFMRIRPWLQALEAMPHLYIQEVMIAKCEIESALRAFNGDGTYQSPQVFVRRWDGTLVRPGTDTPEIERLVGIRLDDLVYWIYQRRPQTFSPPDRHLARLRGQFEEDRQRWRAGQAPTKEHFVRIVQKHSATHGIGLPSGRDQEFAEWIYDSPDRCPGLQLSHEVYRALMENVNDIPATGDFSDLAHVFAIPYVRAATLDRRMRHYCRIASERMLARGGLVNYSGRILENLAYFVAANS